MIYLDNAATTLVKPPEVWKSVFSAMKMCATPGRGTHTAAMRAADRVLSLREKAAVLFGVSSPENVILTYNATYGLNLAIHTLSTQYKRAVVSGFEHNAVIRPLSLFGVEIEYIRSPLFDQDAFISELNEKLNRSPCFVVCTHVSNVFGFRLPVNEVLDICTAKNIPCIIDASQSAGTCSLKEISRLADFIAMPGHKGLYGPQGTGLLICNRVPVPLFAGGTGGNSSSIDMPDFLPDRVEAGTVNVPGAAGLTEGLEFVARKGEKQILKHEIILKNEACDRLSAIQGIHPIWSKEDELQSGTFSFLTDQTSAEEMAQKLGERNIAVRAGLHCAPQAHITAGTFEQGTVRVSFSAFNTKRDVLELCQNVKDIQSRIHIFFR